jgi:hypothetical protein
MLRMCVLRVFNETGSSPAISGRERLVRFAWWYYPRR